MTTRQLLKSLTYIILSLSLLATALVSGRIITPAFADYSASTNVLDDLRTDSAFNAGDYPADASDYSLHVIQIAESTDNELFIYVYNPSALSKIITATSINMSTDEETFSPHLYNLKLLSANGVLRKYQVLNFTVSNSTVRHYDIVSIYRAWDKDIDKGADNDNTISEVAHEVAQKWTASTLNGETVYAMTETEVITVTRKRCGFIRYPEGLKFNTAIGACDGHFVVFSCDRDMDKLLAARVSFIEQSYKKTSSGTTEGTPTPNETYIVHDEYASNTPALFGTRIEWQRIQTGAEFAKSATGLQDDVKTDIATYQWALNFYETTYEAAGGSLAWAGLGPLNPLFMIPAFIALNNATGTWVKDVSILELTFEKNGQVYNLGVVDNKQSGSRDPLNKSDLDLPAWVTVAIIIGALVLVCIALVVLSIIFPPVGKALFAILKAVCTVLWWIISAPFRLIALIVRKISERKEAAPSKTLPKSRRTKAPKAKSTKPHVRTRNTGKAKPRNVKPRAGSKRK